VLVVVQLLILVPLLFPEVFHRETLTDHKRTGSQVGFDHGTAQAHTA